MAGDDPAGLRAVAGVELADAGAGPGRDFTPAEGRRFGVAVGGAFLVLGGLLAWRGHAGAAVVAGLLGLGLAGCGVALPDRLEPVRRGWMALARGLSRVTTPVLLTLIYYLVVTPIGLLRRTLGRHPLRHEPEGRSSGRRGSEAAGAADRGARAASYWRKREDGGKGDLERQF